MKAHIPLFLTVVAAILTVSYVIVPLLGGIFSKLTASIKPIGK